MNYLLGTSIYFKTNYDSYRYDFRDRMRRNHYFYNKREISLSTLLALKLVTIRLMFLYKVANSACIDNLPQLVDDAGCMNIASNI